MLDAEVENELLKSFDKRGGTEESDLYFAQLSPVDPLGARRRHVDPFQYLQSFLQEALPRIRKLDASVRAFEEPRTYLPFERENLLTQRRLRDAEPIGGLAEMQVLRDRREIT